MIRLGEQQWELTDAEGNDGFLFGEGTAAVVKAGGGMDFGSSEARVQDIDLPQADGSLMGRDYFTGPEISFTLGVRDGLDVWSVISRIMQAWRADDVRSTPGALSMLRYRWNGTTYRYLGRPRKFGLVAPDVFNPKLQMVACTFKVAFPEQYIEPEDASTRTLQLNLIEPASDGGVVWAPDLTWPIEFRRSSQARVGDVTVGGFRPAPFKVVVHGPVTGSMSKINLSGDGWQIGTSTTLTQHDTLTIDTAANTIMKNGVSQAGTLSSASRLNARLAPGHQFLTFSATDPSNTGYAVVSWLDTLPA